MGRQERPPREAASLRLCDSRGRYARLRQTMAPPMVARPAAASASVIQGNLAPSESPAPAAGSVVPAPAPPLGLVPVATTTAVAVDGALVLVAAAVLVRVGVCVLNGPLVAVRVGVVVAVFVTVGVNVGVAVTVGVEVGVSVGVGVGVLIPARTPLYGNASVATDAMSNARPIEMSLFMMVVPSLCHCARKHAKMAVSLDCCRPAIYCRT